jgi:hypothetical protein
MDTSVCLLRQTHEDALETLSIHDLASACRTFMAISYPGGAESIPDAKRPYFTMTDECNVADFLPPGRLAVGICQDLSKAKGGVPGFEFRLGSAGHPHLKLRVELVNLHEHDVWVYSVDTHDRFALQAVKNLSPQEAETWRALLEKNSALKKQIEAAFADGGLFTPTSILKVDLT